MFYYSTSNLHHQVDFKTAILNGLAVDEGLYFPGEIPFFSQDFWTDQNFQSPWELASQMLFPYVKSSFTQEEFSLLLQDVLSFDFPYVNLDEVWALELFHGPTLAFKDVGARFLARCMSHVSDRRYTILVATSGDTGSAVAQGFYGLANIDVVILYPKGRISPIQEKQLTTVGANVVALEIEGAFDDCQALVKKAFMDQSIHQVRPLSSANSINIARWIPQSIYYAWTVNQIYKHHGKQVSFCVPSGNYGNLSAGILAMQMGMPCAEWIAASNLNDSVPQYLHSAQFTPHISKTTLSNAMDVGNPSNFIRLLHLFAHSKNTWQNMTQKVYGYRVDDTQTLQTIKDVYQRYKYILDPHSAVAYHAIQQHKDVQTQTDFEEVIPMLLSTASPAKFAEVVKQAIPVDIKLPQRLTEIIQRPSQKISLKADDQAFKDYLIDSKI